MRWHTPSALILAALLGTGPVSLPSRAAIPGYVGSYAWTGDSPLFGGFSAIEVAADGAAFMALSDRGALVTGQLLRDAAGRISGVAAGDPVALAMPPGTMPYGFEVDTEGLAWTGDGDFYVSCESVARVLHYDRPTSIPSALPIPDAFRAMRPNKSLEALAIDQDGTLYTMPEKTSRADGAFPVYRFRNGQWDQPFFIAGRDGFRAAGADIGPDGKLYLLERQFRGFGGFATRVRRIDLVESGVAPEETILQTRPGVFSNLEGIAIWQDAAGGKRMTLISDDNFLALLGTEIVEFRVPD